MSNITEMTLEEMLKAIEGFPYLRSCFSFHLQWLFEKGSDDRRKYDPVYMKVTNDKTKTGLSSFENTFKETGEILGFDEVEFCEAFEFNNPDKNDILKIGDLLAEPWTVVALKNIGFDSIKKVPKNLEQAEKFSDFVGEINKQKFAVEVKNIRTNVDAHQQLVDNAGGKVVLQEEKAFLTNALEQKLNTPQRNKFEEQLRNTANNFDCQKKMLVLYLESSTLALFPDELVLQLEDARKNYSFFDYLGCCINQKLYCSPQLS